MTRDRYRPDEDELERQHEINRRLEIAAEQEPPSMPYRPHRPKPRRRRYFSGVMFRPSSPSEHVASQPAVRRP